MDEYIDRNHLEIELYEKIVVRERRRKLLIVSVALLIFLVLCGVPIFQERLPKWESLKAARQLAVEIEKLKTEALSLKKPLLMKITDSGELVVDQVKSCEVLSDSTAHGSERVYSRMWHESPKSLTLLSESDAKKLKLNFIATQLCFDPVMGLRFSKNKKVLVVLPVKDLAESRLDRASYVEVENQTSKISIN
jgi:hypothetical protein